MFLFSIGNKGCLGAVFKVVMNMNVLKCASLRFVQRAMSHPSLPRSGGFHTIELLHFSTWIVAIHFHCFSALRVKETGNLHIVHQKISNFWGTNTAQSGFV